MTSDRTERAVARLEHLPAKPMTPELVSEIAMEIGKEIASHIEIMYPKAVEATSKNMLLSVRNSVHNDIVAAVEALNRGDAVAWIERRRAHRREMRAAYRKIRDQTFIEGSADYE
jgi:hypothetical protein